MKIRSSTQFKCMLPLLAVAFMVAASGMMEVEAAPPKKPESRVARDLEKVGNFFFRVARKLEQSDLSEKLSDDDREPKIIYEVERSSPPRAENTTPPDPSTGLRLPPGYRLLPDAPNPAAPGVQARIVPQRPSAATYGEPFTPPTFQENPQPNLGRSSSQRDTRTSLNLPVPLAPLPTVPAQAGSAVPASPIVPAGPPASPSSQEKAEPSSTPLALPFADRVPGKQGFVYPPGVEHDLKNMLDVRDFTPGQKVRDPRTGNVFIVPPK